MTEFTTSSHSMPRTTPPHATTIGATRDEFLDRVRRSLAIGAEHRPRTPVPHQSSDPAIPHPQPTPLRLPPVPEELLRLVSRDEDLAARFVQRAKDAGMIVRRCTEANFDAAIADELRRLLPRSPLPNPPPPSVALSIADAPLASAARAAISSVSLTECAWDQSPGLDALYDAAVGITDVTAAIAETGSLVLESSAGLSRGVFLVPPIHLALVRTSQIIADLIDWFQRHPARPIPASMVIVTGPSKTADIEGILVTGVHGPRDVVIILIDSLDHSLDAAHARTATPIPLAPIPSQTPQRSST